MTEAVIGLGGNIGNVRATMASALDLLDAISGLSVERISALYRTPPWGNTHQPDFLNAAALLSTKGNARELLDAALGVERELGRNRHERWGPRTIDLDILLFGDEHIDEAGLQVPHPHLTERAFALAPLMDVMPGAQVRGRTVGDWLDLADRAGMATVAGPDWWRPGLVSPGGPGQSSQS